MIRVVQFCYRDVALSWVQNATRFARGDSDEMPTPVNVGTPLDLRCPFSPFTDCSGGAA